MRRRELGMNGFCVNYEGSAQRRERRQGEGQRHNSTNFVYSRAALADDARLSCSTRGASHMSLLNKLSGTAYGFEIDLPFEDVPKAREREKEENKNSKEKAKLAASLASACGKEFNDFPFV